jgi:hypothetical protein
MLDCQRTLDIQNGLKIDNIADLKTHKENWLDHLKKWAPIYYQDGSPVSAQGATGNRMPHVDKEQVPGSKP